jgi:NitT/TauT family transport system substrate-binding protein
MKKYPAILTVVMLLVGLAACAAPQATPTVEQPGASGDGEPLRVALLPILDSLPAYVAAEKGYFADAGVNVEIVPVASALEREQLMQSGEIDGMLNELHSTAINNKHGVRVQALMTARKAYDNAPLFRVLAAPDSGITGPADLVGVPVGISENTIIEYVTDRLLEEEGLSDDQIVGQSVPAIPERFQLLMEGQIAAATLPDPLAQSAVEQGAVLVIDDSAYPQYAVSVLTFSVDALANRPDDVRALLMAWTQAAEAINADPESYRALLLEKVQVPENVQDTYQIPPFPINEVPTADQWADVVDWLSERDLAPAGLAYEESVTTDYLP